MKTGVLDDLECSKNQPPWGFTLFKLLQQLIIVNTYKFSGIICSVIFDQRYEINKLYKKCIYVKLDFSKFTSPCHSSSSNNLSATERKLSKQSLIGPIRANPDLGSIWAQLWVSLGIKLFKSHLRVHYIELN